MNFRPARELHHLRFYRLIARPPFTVAFPSATFRVEIEQITGAPQWHLIAQSLADRTAWALCRGGENIEWLERELYHTGFEKLHPTVGSTILDRLCVEGRALRLPGLRK